MSIFDRGIRGNVQSPFQALGDASQIPYANPRLPSAYNGNVQLAIDMVVDNLYPNWKGTVANFASLPATASGGDFYIVSDDGDGKSAGYVYSVIEGVSQWIKRYDVDYSAEGILAEGLTRGQYQFVSKYGFSDHDQHGTAITGQYAGQRIFGGSATGQNLTLTANVVDLTGVVQSDNHFLPTLFNTLDVGAAAMKWRSGYFKSSLVVDTTTLMPGSLVDSSGNFTFNALNLSTTGTLSSGAAQVSGSLMLSAGVLTDSSGSLSFGGNNLGSIGTLTAGVITGAASSKLADITFTAGTFNTASSAFNFSGKDFTNVGNITTATFTTTTLNVGSMVLNGQLIKTTADATSLNLQGGTGSASSSVKIQSPLTVTQTLAVTGTSVFTGAATFSSGATFTGAVTLNTSPLQITSNFQLASSGTAATISSGGSLGLVAPSGLTTTGNFSPTTDASLNLGAPSLRFKNLYLSGGITDGTNTVSNASLLSLRDINTGATSGMSLFYNGTEWLPSIPDTEIDHRTLSGLNVGDSGHPQFLLLAGRAGGQTAFGGTASGENLTLDSTSNATKGFVLTSSTFAPTTDSAIDLGAAAKQFRHMYSSGLHYGLRFDQYAGSANYPSNASAKIGRVIWDTSINQLLVDNGTSWSKVGNQKWLSDQSFDGSTTTQTVTVSAQISDARTAIWQLLDNTNNFQPVYATLTKTQTTVVITSSPALPAGSYRLIGFN